MGHIIMHPSIHLHIACARSERQGKNKYARQVAHCFHRQTFNSSLAPLLFSGPAPQIMETHQPHSFRTEREGKMSQSQSDDERQGAEVHCGTSDMGFKNLYLFNCRSLWHKKEVYFTHFSVLDGADKRVCCLRSNEKKSLHAPARSQHPPTAYTRESARLAKNSFFCRGEWNGKERRRAELLAL